MCNSVNHRCIWKELIKSIAFLQCNRCRVSVKCNEASVRELWEVMVIQSTLDRVGTDSPVSA